MFGLLCSIFSDLFWLLIICLFWFCVCCCLGVVSFVALVACFRGLCVCLFVGCLLICVVFRVVACGLDLLLCVWVVGWLW